MVARHEHRCTMQVLSAFRTSATNVLVVTDVLSRGLDVAGIHIVVNYNFPKTMSDYVNRCGRTVRHCKGIALSMLGHRDLDFAQ